jgi:hypothetical protein
MGLEERAELLRGMMGELSLAAVQFVPRAKIEETSRHWLAGERIGQNEKHVEEAISDALTLALDVALFTPSTSGATAIDRFARQYKSADAEQQAALDALRGSTFRVLQIGSPHPQGGYQLADLATGDRFRLIDQHFPTGCEGLAIAARIAAIDGDTVVTTGPVTPLDDATLAIAQARMRPNARGLTNPNRCAEAIYRHVVRFGAPEIAGLNRPPEGEGWTFLFSPEDGPVHALAFAWSEAETGFEPSAAEVRAVRELATEPDLLEALTGCAAARQLEVVALAAAYERVLTIQLETIERRAATGLTGGHVSLKAIADQIRQAVHKGMAPAEIETVFEEVRRRVRVSGLGRPAAVNLDKVLTRIQALRTKTVDRGCTEEETIAAAEKVAELLDRYGLSLSEVELKDQNCEGFGVGTGRRRFGPIDSCIPAVGEFCDCRVWSEKAADGEIRYVFFGLPADVAGARYLYELVQRAFATETELFKRSELYAEHRPGDRRSATQSFQTGLAHGIARKLDALRQRREETMRTATGRDLVPVKEAVIEEELAKLGLRFQTRGSGRGRYVLRDAYEAGHDAGDRFEYRSGITEDPMAEAGG